MPLGHILDQMRKFRTAKSNFSEIFFQNNFIVPVAPLAGGGGPAGTGGHPAGRMRRGAVRCGWQGQPRVPRGSSRAEKNGRPLFFFTLTTKPSDLRQRCSERCLDRLSCQVS